MNKVSKEHARQQAENQLWQLEGYLLQNKLKGVQE